MTAVLQWANVRPVTPEVQALVLAQFFLARRKQG